MNDMEQGLLSIKTWLETNAALLSGPVEIIASEFMVDHVQVRFPNSKKRRIRERWAKRGHNYRAVPLSYAFHYGNKFIMHPQLKAKLVAQLGGAIPGFSEAVPGVPQQDIGEAWFNGQRIGNVYHWEERSP